MTYPGEQPPTAPGQPQNRPPSNRPTAKRRRLWLSVAAAAVLVAGVAAALVLPRLGEDAAPTPAVAIASATTSTAPTTMTVRGTLQLGLGHFSWESIGSIGQPGPSCSGDGGFNDIAVGTPVSITDAAGDVVALGKLDGSNPMDFSAANTPTACELGFSIAGVPAGKGFYGIEVSGRGAVKFAEGKLAEPVQLTLD